MNSANLSLSTPLAEAAVAWKLNGKLSANGNVEEIELAVFPFQIGRRPGLSLAISFATVSSAHAEIDRDGDGVFLRDLGSTNGTFVNGKQVKDKERLRDGDLIQLADVPFRLSARFAGAANCTRTAEGSASDLALSLIQFDKLLNERAVVPHFQPIVTITEETIVGYEVLGRSNLFGLQTPHDMFLAASQLDLEGELSAMLRVAGVSGAPQACLNLFLNTHPVEIVTSGLHDSLIELRKQFPNQPLTLEVHEASATDLHSMKELKSRLHDLDVQLAYDDFGVGQSRLVEMAEVGPDVVKFDMQLIRDIHKAPARHHQMVRRLVQMVRGLDSKPLAEGVETAEEHAVCRDLGFELGQGYFYGKPLPASSADMACRRSDLF